MCEEHEEILRTAWVEEQALQKQREKEVSVNIGPLSSDACFSTDQLKKHSDSTT